MIRVASPRVDALPGAHPRWRLTTELVVEGGPDPGRDELWLEGPGSPETVDAGGTPWAVMLAPLAARLDMPLSIEAVVDARTANGIVAASRIWSGWYPDASVVRLEAPRLPGPGAGQPTGPTVGPGTERTAAFFTGGVDSSWTALQHRGTGAEVRDLITVHGFDIPLTEDEAFRRMTARFRDWAGGWGGAVVDLRTNLRETRADAAPWGPLAHGCALIGSGLALGARYDVLRLAATGGIRDPHPWGSHRETDHLFGTQRTRIDHHGAEAPRWEKVRAIVADPGATALLRVCWRSGTDRNCGSCSKCLRTMALLDLWGALERSPTFPDRLPLDALERVHVKESWDVREFTDLVVLGRRHGRPDLVAAATGAMRRSRRGARALAVLDRLAGAPAIGRAARSWGARIREEWIA